MAKKDEDPPEEEPNDDAISEEETAEEETAEEVESEEGEAEEAPVELTVTDGGKFDPEARAAGNGKSCRYYAFDQELDREIRCSRSK